MRQTEFLVKFYFDYKFLENFKIIVKVKIKVGGTQVDHVFNCLTIEFKYILMLGRNI